MGSLQIGGHNGIDTAGDELRLGAGFLRRAEGCIFLPDDPNRLHKQPGRTLTSALSIFTGSTTYGFLYLQFDGGTDKFVVLTASQLLEMTPPALGSANDTWDSVVNQADEAFPHTGNFLRQIPDGGNNYILWSGASTERPLMRTADGKWFYVSLKPPSVAPVLEGLSAAPDPLIRPTSSSNPTLVSGSNTYAQAAATLSTGGNGGAFSPPAGTTNAAVVSDNNFVTASRIVTTDINSHWATDWIMNSGATTSGHYLFFNVSVGLTGAGWGSSQPVDGTLYVQVSENGGTNWTTVFRKAIWDTDGHLDSTANNYQVAVSDGVLSQNIRVRVFYHYNTGTRQIAAYVYEMWLQKTQGGQIFIDAGTYTYAATEVFVTIDTATGNSTSIESAPSPLATYTAAGTEYGVKLTLPAASNTTADGIKDDSAAGYRHYRQIYRTTGTGVWPDLGKIGEAAIAATTFIDDFSTAGDTLGEIPLNVVYAQDVAVYAAGMAPAFRDAVFYRGIVVAIPEGDPHRLQWSLPGFPHYWPSPAHDLPLLPSDRNDELKGITAIQDAIVVFLRTRVVRIRNLPIVGQANYDPANTEIDILSPNEGLAGGPLSHCLFYSQKGHAVVAWISDNGIWMTDGSLVSEGGMGIVKLSVLMDWRGEVDTSQLAETRLAYDPILQCVYFDYIDKVTTLRTCKTLHTGPHHWVQTGQDQAVPKTLGPHTQFAAKQRAFGESAGLIQHWSLNTATPAAPKLNLERYGTDLAGTAIRTHIETGWSYPAEGVNNAYWVEEARLLHPDWGPSEACDVELITRTDKSGVVQTRHGTGLSLAGSRPTSFKVWRAGNTFRAIIRHVGSTISNGTALRAFGPLELEVKPQGETS